MHKKRINSIQLHYHGCGGMKIRALCHEEGSVDAASYSDQLCRGRVVLAPSSGTADEGLNVAVRLISSGTNVFHVFSPSSSASPKILSPLSYDGFSIQGRICQHSFS